MSAVISDILIKAAQLSYTEEKEQRSTILFLWLEVETSCSAG